MRKELDVPIYLISTALPEVIEKIRELIMLIA